MEWRDVVIPWGKKALLWLKEYKLVFLVILAGVMLLLWPTSEGETYIEEMEEVAQTNIFQLEAVEEKLEEVLSEIHGAGDVRVVLSLYSGTRTVVAQEGKTTSDGDSMSNEVNTVVVSTGSGTEEVVTLQEIAPQFQGALVVCPGGDNATVKLNVTQAVAAITGLSTDKIAVCKGN